MILDSTNAASLDWRLWESYSLNQLVIGRLAALWFIFSLNVMPLWTGDYEDWSQKIQINKINRVGIIEMYSKPG